MAGPGVSRNLFVPTPLCPPPFASQLPSGGHRVFRSLSFSSALFVSMRNAVYDLVLAPAFAYGRGLDPGSGAYCARKPRGIALCRLVLVSHDLHGLLAVLPFGSSACRGVGGVCRPLLSVVSSDMIVIRGGRRPRFAAVNWTFFAMPPAHVATFRSRIGMLRTTGPRRLGNDFACPWAPAVEIGALVLRVWWWVIIVTPMVDRWRFAFGRPSPSRRSIIDTGPCTPVSNGLRPGRIVVTPRLKGPQSTAAQYDRGWKDANTNHLGNGLA